MNVLVKTCHTAVRQGNQNWWWKRKVSNCQ